jgi:hypothetical protein
MRDAGAISRYLSRMGPPVSTALTNSLAFFSNALTCVVNCIMHTHYLHIILSLHANNFAHFSGVTARVDF